MATLDLITVAEAKRAVNIPTDDSTQDTEIGGYVTAVSQRIDTLCGPVVRRTVTDEAHDGGATAIYLRRPPASSITSVVEWDQTVSTALSPESVSSHPANAYLADLSAGVVRRRSRGAPTTFPAGRANILVTYVAGRYADTATVDEKFKVAASMTLAYLWRREQVASSQQVSAFQRSWGLPIPRGVLELVGDELLLAMDI